MQKQKTEETNLSNLIDYTQTTVKLVNDYIDKRAVGEAEISRHQGAKNRLIEKNEHTTQWLRLLYGIGIFGAVIIYIFSVLVIVGLFVFSSSALTHHVNSLIITLLSTTTVNVIGLLMAVILNLFPKNPEIS